MGAYIIRNLTTLGNEEPGTLIKFMDKSVDAISVFLRCVPNTNIKLNIAI